MKRKILLCIVAMFVSLTTFAQIDTLKVDFNRTGNDDTEEGWVTMSYADKALPADAFSSFVKFGASVEIRPVILSTPVNDNVRAVYRANQNLRNYATDEEGNVLSHPANLFNVIRDYIAVDAMVLNAETGTYSNTIAIEVKGLPAGTYTWKSYHHDTDDQRGKFNVKIEKNDALLVEDTNENQISFSNISHILNGGYATKLEDVSTYFYDKIVSTGPEDIFRVSFSSTKSGLDLEGNHGIKFILINGFELTPSAIIETTPGSLSFNGVGTKQVSVTGTDLRESISIVAPQGYTVVPETLASTASAEAIDVTFDGIADVGGYIYLTSGTAIDSIMVNGTQLKKDTLSVDFNRSGNTSSEPGWDVIQIADKAIPSAEFSSFDKFGNSTVYVRPVWTADPVNDNIRAIYRDNQNLRNYAKDEEGNSLDHAANLFSVIRDYIAVDAMVLNAETGTYCNTLAIEVKGLPAGKYAWKSYHHDTDDQRGKFKVKIENNDVLIIEEENEYQLSFSNISHVLNDGYATKLEDVSTYKSIITSNGPEDIIKVSFANSKSGLELEGNHGIKFTLINGFSLTEASGNAYLTTLSVADNTLSPEFGQDVLIYNVELPVGTTIEMLPEITYATSDDAVAFVTAAAELPGATTIKVTSQDGTAEKTYTINFSVKEASTDATLTLLEVEGNALTPEFDANVFSYTVKLPASTTVETLPLVTFTGADNADAVKTDASTFPGTTTIKVTAEDGVTNNTYSIEFSVNTSTRNLDEDEVSVFPIPASDVITIAVPSTLVGGKMSIYNLQGSLLNEKEITQVVSEINISDLPAGAYFVNISKGNNIIVKKVIKQ